jgi:hypothetical protein
VQQRWLVPLTAPKGRVAPRYLLCLPSASRTVEPSASDTVDDGNSPADDGNSPADDGNSPADGPNCSSNYNSDNNNNTARDAGGNMIFTTEDRKPDSNENLADRLRGLGVDWTDYEVGEAVRRLTKVFGADAASLTPAVAVLTSLATRHPRPVERIGAYLAKIASESGDDGLRALRPQDGPRKRSAAPPTRPDWCGRCFEPSRRIEDADTGADRGKCPRCHPDSAPAEVAA